MGSTYNVSGVPVDGIVQAENGVVFRGLTINDINTRRRHFHFLSSNNLDPVIGDMILNSRDTFEIMPPHNQRGIWSKFEKELTPQAASLDGIE